MDIIISAPQGEGKTAIAELIIADAKRFKKIKTKTEIYDLSGEVKDHVASLSEIKPDAVIFDEIATAADLLKAVEIVKEFRKVRQVLAIYIEQGGAVILTDKAN